METLLISAVTVENFKRIEKVEIEPPADRAIILIAGDNAQGKTSLMDALTGAFGGKGALPQDPVRHGADVAEIKISLAGGEEPITIRRTIKPDGSSTLEVREDGVKARSPQAVLDAIIGDRFLDPLSFLQKDAKEQRRVLLNLAIGEERLAELDRKRLKAYDKRTEIGGALRRASAEIERIPVVKAAAPIDIAKLAVEARQVEESLRGVDVARAEFEANSRAFAAKTAEMDRARRAIADVEAQLEKLRTEAADLEIKVADAAEAARASGLKADELEQKSGTAMKRRDEILFEQRRAQDHNAKVAADEQLMNRRRAAETEANELSSQHDDCTKVIDKIDQRKLDLLAEAKFPVDGLGFTDDAVTLNGVPLAQASGAERWRVALGLAIASSKRARDVWVRDGALLDDASLDAVEELARKVGARVWVERVGKRDPGAIIISEGKVKK